LLLANNAFLFAPAHGAVSAVPELPSLQQIVALHGKPTSSPEFTEVAKICSLKLFIKKEEVLLIADFSTRAPYPMESKEIYGGSGLIVEVSRTAFISGDLRAPGDISRTIVFDPPSGPFEPTVTRTKLIVGDCPEIYMFGLWKGEKPRVEKFSTPQELMEKYRRVDTDLVDVKYARGGEGSLERRRVINYYAPAFGSEVPYSFEFWGKDEDKLAMIAVWPVNVRFNTIRPTPPKVIPP
jgi:hypothetical protein